MIRNYQEEVKKLEKEIADLVETNIALSHRMRETTYGGQVSHLFGRPLNEIFGILEREKTPVDLTKIDQPFGTLDIETKLALHRAYYEGKRVMFRSPREASSMCARTPSWAAEYIYFVAPPPQRDIQVPWNVFGPEVQWAARDECGSVYLYEDKPHITPSKWMVHGTTMLRIDNLHLIGFDPGDKPWDQSLVRRPEGV